MEGKHASVSRVTLTQVMGPSSANSLGNVHGGILMKLCDEAGGMTAAKHARHSAVTVSVDSMSFHSPVHVGYLVTFAAEISWVGRSSMETRVHVTAENVLTGEITHTNTAYYVYVAINEEGRPVPVPPLLLETEAEKSRFERGAKRQAYRLEQRRQGTI